MAQELGVPVVYDFRSSDVRSGGQGAPLVPIVHQLLANTLPRPLAIVNIGGVANVTYLGTKGEGDMLAFDTGPGNALIDDWALRHTGVPCDRNGELAAHGKVHNDRMQTAIDLPFFRAAPPKSLDRMDFTLDVVSGLGPEDGAATLTALTCEAIVKAAAWMPEPPLRWLVCGGGRHNPVIMQTLQREVAIQHASVLASLDCASSACPSNRWRPADGRATISRPRRLPCLPPAASPACPSAIRRLQACRPRNAAERCARLLWTQNKMEIDLLTRHF